MEESNVAIAVDVTSSTVGIVFAIAGLLALRTTLFRLLSRKISYGADQQPNAQKSAACCRISYLPGSKLRTSGICAFSTLTLLPSLQLPFSAAPLSLNLHFQKNKFTLRVLP